MKLYQPQLLLVLKEDGSLFLHSTTFFDTINMLPKGHLVKKKVTKKGVLKVELFAIADNSLPADINYVNAVVHHVDLGNILEVDEEGNLNGSVEATVYILPDRNAAKSRSDRNRRKAGSSTVRSPTTGSNTRPNPNKN